MRTLSNRKKKQHGHIEVIHGGMFAGKSSENQRRLKRHHMANKTVILYKHAKDVRYDEKMDGSTEYSASHEGNLFPAISVEDVAHIVVPDDVDVIGIDEGQFMGPELTRWCTAQVTDFNRIVIVSCLDTTFEMKPWPNIGPLLCVAEKSDKLAAICCECGEDAAFSRRITDGTDEIQVGGSDMYVPTCREHHSSPIEGIEEHFGRVSSLQLLNKSFDTTQ